MVRLQIEYRFEGFGSFPVSLKSEVRPGDLQLRFQQAWCLLLHDKPLLE